MVGEQWEGSSGQCWCQIEGDVREEDLADGCECAENLNYGNRKEAPPKQVSTENFYFAQLRESIKITLECTYGTPRPVLLI